MYKETYKIKKYYFFTKLLIIIIFFTSLVFLLDKAIF